jgi:hypothetical protein
VDAIVQRHGEYSRFQYDQRHFHLDSFFSVMGFLVRFQGKWYEIHPKPYEPERMTLDIAWIQIRDCISSADAYRKWFERQRKLSRILQQ